MAARERSIEGYLDDMVLVSLRLMNVSLIAISLVFFLGRLFFDTSPTRTIALLFLLVLPAVCIPLYITHWRAVDRPWIRRLHAALAIGALLIVLLSSFFFQIDQLFSNAVMLVMVGMGLVLLDRRELLAGMSLMVFVWLVANLLVEHSQLNFANTLGMVCAWFCSLLFRTVREIDFRERYRLLMGQRARRQRLDQALAEGERQQAELAHLAARRAAQAESTKAELERRRADRLELDENISLLGPQDALGRLAGGVAQDFQKLMAALNPDFTELEKLLGSNESDAEFLQDALEAHHQITDLVGELLALSRQQKLNSAVRSTAELLGEFCGGLGSLLAENMDISFTVEPGALPIFVDNDQLNQALLNLAINAQEAMPSGGRLHFSAAREGPNIVKISVADSGSGIDKEDQRRVFEPYFTTKSLYEGKGLGLSVVEGIIAQHGGSVEVGDSSSQGTTIVIRLPLAGADFLDPNGIVLLDDDIEERDLLGRYLLELGCKVRATGDEAEVRAIFAESSPRPGIILMDRLPSNYDGKSLLVELRGLAPTLKVIMLVDTPEQAVAGGTDQAVGVHVLSRPISFERLTELMKVAR